MFFHFLVQLLFYSPTRCAWSIELIFLPDIAAKISSAIGSSVRAQYAIALEKIETVFLANQRLCLTRVH